MAAEVSRDEFSHLDTRVDVLEREVEGEKMVTRHILEQTRHNGDDLAAIKTRLDRVERKVDVLDHKIDNVEGRLGGKIDSFQRSLPGLVGEVMREVLRERDDMT